MVMGLDNLLLAPWIQVAAPVHLTHSIGALCRRLAGCRKTVQSLRSS